jgi:hypothetical protein
MAPCYTKVLVRIDEDKWTIRAREKLGLPLKGNVTEEQAQQIKLEAGKLKTVASIKAINPTAIVTGLTVGSKKLTIQVNI